MKYCQKCGKELFDEAVICPGCGCMAANVAMTDKAEAKEPPVEGGGLAVCSVIFSVLVPLVGLILGIIGVAQYQTKENRERCLKSIVRSAFVAILGYLMLQLALLGGF